MIWPTSLLVQESQGITAPLHEHEPDLARSAQLVNHEKHLVLCEVGALTHDLFQIAGRGSVQDVDHLIFHGARLRHLPPVEEWNALLRGESCIVGATGWCRRMVEEDVRSHRELQA